MASRESAVAHLFFSFVDDLESMKGLQNGAKGKENRRKNVDSGWTQAVHCRHKNRSPADADDQNLLPIGY